MTARAQQTLLDLINRKPIPDPWEDGDNIPWDDPDFSTRMLAEHLSQAHDAASRRSATIAEQVQWIHTELLKGKPTRILDVCCGPGLYTSRLAALGHECVGIDFAPAAIQYAQEQARAQQLACQYTQADVRQAGFGGRFGLAMVLYGQINVFRRSEAAAILRRARQALVEGGVLLLEPHTLDAVERMGKEPSSWYSCTSGLFSDRPHVMLEEHFWHAAGKSATTRFLVIDAADASVTRYAMTTQSYTDEEYRALLQDAGFSGTRFLRSLAGQADTSQPGLFVLIAHTE